MPIDLLDPRAFGATPEQVAGPTQAPVADLTSPFAFGATPEHLPLLNEVSMTAARERIRQQVPEEGFEQYITHINPVSSLAVTTMADRARRRIEAGTPEPSDYNAVAYEERLQEFNRERGPVGQSLRTLANVGELAGEAFIGGTAVRGLGTIVGLGARAGTRAAPTALGRLGSLAANTAAVPSMILPRMADVNIQEGRDPLDLRGAPPALALGMIQTAILGYGGNVANRITGSTIPAVLTRGAARTVAMAGSQEAADVLTSGINRHVQDTFGISLGLDTGFGTFGDIVRGDNALGHAAQKMLMFAAFAGIHELHGRDRVLDAGTNAFRRLRSDGYTAEGAGRRLEAVQRTMSDAIEENPVLRRSEARDLYNHIPEGRLRDYAMALADSLPTRTAPQVEHLPPFMEEGVGPFPRPTRFMMALRTADGAVHSDPSALHHAEVMINKKVNPDNVTDTGYVDRQTGQYVAGNPRFGPSGEITSIEPYSRPNAAVVGTNLPPAGTGVSAREQALVDQARQAATPTATPSRVDWSKPLTGSESEVRGIVVTGGLKAEQLDWLAAFAENYHGRDKAEIRRRLAQSTVVRFGIGDLNALQDAISADGHRTAEIILRPLGLSPTPTAAPTPPPAAPQAQTPVQSAPVPVQAPPAAPTPALTARQRATALDAQHLEALRTLQAAQATEKAEVNWRRSGGNNRQAMEAASKARQKAAREVKRIERERDQAGIEAAAEDAAAKAAQPPEPAPEVPTVTPEPVPEPEPYRIGGPGPLPEPPRPRVVEPETYGPPEAAGPPRPPIGPVAAEKRNRAAALEDLWNRYQAAHDRDPAEARELVDRELLQAAQLEPRLETVIREGLRGQTYEQIAEIPEVQANNRQRVQQLEQDALDLMGAKLGTSIRDLLALRRLEKLQAGVTAAEIGQGEGGAHKTAAERFSDIFPLFNDAVESPSPENRAALLKAADALDAALETSLRDPFIKQNLPFIREYLGRVRGFLAGEAQGIEGVAAPPPHPDAVLAAIREAMENGQFWQIGKMQEVMDQHFDPEHNLAIIRRLAHEMGITGFATKVKRAAPPTKARGVNAVAQAQEFKNYWNEFIEKQLLLQEIANEATTPADHEAVQAGFQAGATAKAPAGEAGEGTGEGGRQVAGPEATEISPPEGPGAIRRTPGRGARPEPVESEPVPGPARDTGDFGRPLTAEERRMGSIGGGQEDATGGTPRPHTTALAHAVSDAERELMGMAPREISGSTSDQAVMNEANKRLDADPMAAANLVAEINANPRAVAGDVENALLLRRKIATRNAADRATNQAIDLHDQAQRNPALRNDPDHNERIIQAERLQEQRQREFNETMDAIDKSGSEAGGAFRWRRMLMEEDASLAGLLRSAQAAKGKPLSADEMSQVKALQAEIEKLQKKLAEVEAGMGDTTDASIDVGNARRQMSRYIEGLRYSQMSPQQKALRNLTDTWDASRAIITALDLSASLRQGAIYSFAHPIDAATRIFPESIKALFNERAHQRIMEKINKDPIMDLAREANLFISDEANLLRQEESHIGRWTNRIPGVAASARAYSAFINLVRLSWFKSLVGGLGTDGKATLAEAKAIARMVNISTGRGDLYMFEKSAVGMARIFFSPKHFFSRFQLLAGVPFYEGTARTRKAIAGEFGRALAGLGLFYAIAKIAGGDDTTVSFDPRSSDFGKVKIRNTRIDPLAGLSQTAVLMARLGTGEQVSTITGRESDLRGDQRRYGARDIGNVIWTFLRSKAAPIPGAIGDVLHGETVVHEPVTPGLIASKLTIPISIRDVWESMTKEEGVPRGVAASLLAILGMGVATYGRGDRIRQGVTNVAPASQPPVQQQPPVRQFQPTTRQIPIPQRPRGILR